MSHMCCSKIRTLIRRQINGEISLFWHKNLVIQQLDQMTQSAEYTASLLRGKTSPTSVLKMTLTVRY